MLILIDAGNELDAKDPKNAPARSRNTRAVTAPQSLAVMPSG